MRRSHSRCGISHTGDMLLFKPGSHDHYEGEFMPVCLWVKEKVWTLSHFHVSFAGKQLFMVASL